MTSEQKVRKVYPQAFCQKPSFNTFKVFRIWSAPMDGVFLGEGVRRESWAWADAAAKIAANKESP